MRGDYTDITMILDRSGSMADCTEATIEAVNGFVSKQKEGIGKCLFSLIQFDNLYEPNYIGRDVHEVQPLNKETYVPRGGTALNDAIGRTINELGARLRAMPEIDRPITVMVVIQTDGYENSSREFSKAKILEMISHQRDTFKWDFVFLGAGIDAIASAADYGLAAGSALSYGKGLSGKTFNKMSNNLNTMRSAKLAMVNAGEFVLAQNTSYEVSAEDRKEAVDESCNKPNCCKKK